MTQLALRRHRIRLFRTLGILVVILLGNLGSLWTQGYAADPSVPLAGGATTSFIRSSQAYEQPSANLSQANLDKHAGGDAAFEAVFVTAPAKINPGLGPHFNNASCASCHIRNGRGLPTKGQLLVRVSGQDPRPESSTSEYQAEPVAPGENVNAVPGLGTQIQDQAIFSVPPEATVELQWSEVTGEYGDGSSYPLRSPTAVITLPDGQPLADSVSLSLRVPPPVIGVGLLEAVPETTLLALADPDDLNQDGISGRANVVWDVQKGQTAVGRFGLKANQPNLVQQTAAAYVNDMGVTNPLFPATDGSYDIDEETLDLATFYTVTLAVPARTLVKDPVVVKGEQLFNEANCTACHLSTLQTGGYPVLELADQTIHPYTDLLLHDMGEGLADNRPDFAATGQEWRTPALWGLGVAQTVLPYAKYLHDGRARTLAEAILWHGGEAEASKERFRTMSLDDRKALVRFLRTL